MGGPYRGIVEFLALTGQRREEVARMKWNELDIAQRVWTIPKSRTKNAKEHVVHLSEQSMAVLKRVDKKEPFVFSLLGAKPFQQFSGQTKLDQLSGVDRMAPSRLAPDLRVRDGPARNCAARGGQNPQPSGWHNLRGRSRISTTRVPFGPSRGARPLGSPYRRNSQRKTRRAPYRAKNCRLSIAPRNRMYLTA